MPRRERQVHHRQADEAPPRLRRVRRQGLHRGREEGPAGRGQEQRRGRHARAHRCRRQLWLRGEHAGLAGWKIIMMIKFAVNIFHRVNPMGSVKK